MSHTMNRLSATVVAVLVAAFALAPLRIASASAATTSYADPAAQAAATGQPVELTDQDTETDTVYVNPDGTYTRDVSPEPVRVRVGTGWQSINYALVRQADGSYGPTVAPASMYARLSGGGTQPLITEIVGGVSLTLTWPTALPTPVVATDRSSLTYPNVISGVDLTLTVGDQGVTDILTVNSKSALAALLVSHLAFGVKVVNGSLGTQDGGLALLDTAGRVVAQAPEPTFWDSAGGTSSTVTGVSGGERLYGAQLGDHVGHLALSISSGQLTLTPDLGDFASAAPVYPMYIDPSTAPIQASSWTMLSEQNPNLPGWMWGGKNGQGVGYWHDDRYPASPASKKRLLWRFGLPSLHGAKIISASFTSHLIWSSSCTNTAVNLFQTSSFGPHTTWTTQPSVGSWHATVSNVTGWIGCPTSSDGSPMRFNVLPAIQSVADVNGHTVYFEMRAASESDPLGWKRVRNLVSLSINYNRPPNPASSLRLGTSPCNKAKLGGGALAPKLYAHLSDPDGDKVYMVAYYSGPGITGTKSVTSGRFPSGSNASVDLPLPSKSGTFSLKVRAFDASNLQATNYSATCTFIVDLNAPSPPGIVVPAGVDWTPGVINTLTLVPGGLVKDTIGYRYRLDSDSPPTTAILAAQGSDHHLDVNIATPDYGIHTLYVWAYDSVHNQSEPASYQFDVDSLVEPDWWSYSFDNALSATTVADVGQASVKHPMQLTTSAINATRGTYEDSKKNILTDGMLQLGAAPAVGRGVAAIPLQAGQSFTVSAWLDPVLDSDNPRTMTALAYGNSTTPWVKLGVDQNGYYFFSVWDTGSASYRTVRTNEIDDGLPGFREVVGTYQATTKLISISASEGPGLWDTHEIDQDDSTDGSEPLVTLLSNFSTGHLEVGDESWATKVSENWNGRIDQVDVAQGWAGLHGRSMLYNAGSRSYCGVGSDPYKECAS